MGRGREKNIAIAAVCAMAVFLFPKFALANSSWHWLTNRTPLNVLPYAAVVTILIELCFIKALNSITKTRKVLLFVCLGNLASFFLPYAALFMPGLYTMDMTIQYTPIFIIGFGYYALTLAAEIPIVYNGLKKDARSKKTLLLTVVLVNALTTFLVFFAERMISPGSW